MEGSDIVQDTGEGAALRRSPRVSHAVALGIASLSLFWGTGAAYYHFFRLGTAVEENLYTNAIVFGHDFLGVSAVLLLCGFPFLWAMVYFFEEERIGGLAYKAFGTAAAAGFLSMLCGLLGESAWGGSFGTFVGGKLGGVFGEKIAAAILLVSLGISLFLATERFFSLRRFAERVPAPAPPSGPAEQIGLEIEESQALVENRVVSEIIPEPPTQAAAAVSEVLSLEERVEPAAPPKKRERKRKEPEKFDLEAVLEIAPEEKPAPPADLPRAGGDSAELLAGSGDLSAAADGAPAADVAERRQQQEEKREKLEEAVERATQDYVLPAAAAPPVPESDSAGMFDRAARLVIEEGRASVSLLQRRLGVPFSRASLLLDLLEKEGVIGPYRGGPSRAILLGLAEWEQRAKARAQDTSSLPQA